MPFSNALVTVPGGKTSKASLSYKRNKRSKTKGTPNLLIGIPKSIAGDSVKKGDCFKIMLGDGADLGKARLVRCSNGEAGAHAAIMKGAITLRFGHVPILGNDAAEKEDIEAEMTSDGSFELELPKWFAGRV